MKPPDPDAESLLPVFHCQQAVQKFLKALLTYYQVEFPKTHDIERLLTLVGRVNREAAEALKGASWREEHILVV
jgi:HEPN domain-containing protein